MPENLFSDLNRQEAREALRVLCESDADTLREAFQGVGDTVHAHILRNVLAEVDPLAGVPDPMPYYRACEAKLLRAKEVPLSEVEEFHGHGVYLLTDRTEDSLWAALARYDYPVYFGKSDCKVRKAEIKLPPRLRGLTRTGTAMFKQAMRARNIFVNGVPVPQDPRFVNSRDLYFRLRDHRDILKGREIDVSKIYAKWLLISNWVSQLAVESLVIARYFPLWNVMLTGFGKHGDGKSRVNATSIADILYPREEQDGDPVAFEGGTRVPTPAEIKEAIDIYLKQMGFVQ